MAGGRPLPPLVLSVEENNQLVEWTRRRKTAQALALRSRMILACAQPAANQEVAQRLHVTPQTVGKWRSRFVARRLDGLLDEPRPGAPRQVGDAEVERVIASTGPIFNDMHNPDRGPVGEEKRRKWRAECC